ncbi:hypothetical protein SLE2022_264160 [Rubroshorea leprosula]
MALFRIHASITNVCTVRFLSSSTLNLPKLQLSEDADTLSQILLTQHNPFHSMECSLQLHGISLSSFLLDQTLLRLQNSSKVALPFFHFSKSLPHSPSLLSTTSYNIMIDILAKVCQFDIAWQLIVEMDKTNIDPDSSTFMILVRRLIAAGLTRQAIRTVDDMECFVALNDEDRSFCFCYLLDTLCKYGYVKQAVEFFNKRKSQFRPDLKMYTILISGWCKIKRIDMAEKFLKEMIDRGIEPNLVTFNVLLDGICRRASLHPDERFQRTIMNAERVFDEMHHRGIEPDVTSYSIVLHVYSRAHKPEVTIDKLKEMKEKGIHPTVATYTSVMKCLCSCGRIEEAEVLLGEMIRDGVSPSAATYNCFLKEYKGRKGVSAALKLYRMMKEDHLCEPSMLTYNLLLQMFLKWGEMETINEIWADLKGTLSGPDLDSYTVLIHGFCQKQRWKEACQYFVEMIERGLLPQKATFEMLYRGLIQSDMLRTWRRLQKRLDEESITFASEFENYPLKPYRR